MIRIGTSGYNYPEWKGRFYPADLPAAKMLAWYAGRFTTVEVNYTFYRMPTPKLVAGWAAQVPESFTFTLKAPRRITHDRRLGDIADPLRAFCDAAATLGPRLGCLLFQLPPNMKVDLAKLEAFLAELPPGARAAMEFRHESWWTDEVYDRLRAKNVALCIADSETRHTPVVVTADYGYLRLRDEGYGEVDIARWADVVRAHADAWRDTFVYFKHEDEGKGPEFAAQLVDRLSL
jgi:uncharacterized protein YecE (DUF72 family)